MMTVKKSTKKGRSRKKRSNKGRRQVMKKEMKGFLAIIVTLGLFIGFLQASSASGAVTLEVLNPRGEIKAMPSSAPTPRVADLAGKKIGIYWIGKAGGNNFFDEIEQLLKAKFPTAQILRFNGPFDLGADMAAKIAKEFDTVIYGVGD
jgi:hypothetical protein